MHIINSDTQWDESKMDESSQASVHKLITNWVRWKEKKLSTGLKFHRKADLAGSSHCCCVTNHSKVVVWTNRHFIMHMDTVDQEFGEGTAGMACLWFMTSGASVGKTWTTRNDLRLGAGIIWKLLHLTWDDLKAHSAGTVKWSIYM